MINKTSLTALYLKNKALSLGVGFLALATVLVSAHAGNAAIFNFSFSNVTGKVTGTVSGTINLPNGDGTFAATSVTVNSFPVGLGYDPTNWNWVTLSSENTFIVKSGNISVAAGSNFYGSKPCGAAFCALGMNVQWAEPFVTFLDAFNGSGVIDGVKVPTLTFSSAGAVPEPLTILGTGTALGMGAFFKRQQAKKQQKEKAKA